VDLFRVRLRTHARRRNKWTLNALTFKNRSSYI
jgi:hypothetical protein